MASDERQPFQARYRLDGSPSRCYTFSEEQLLRAALKLEISIEYLFECLGVQSSVAASPHSKSPQQKIIRDAPQKQHYERHGGRRWPNELIDCSSSNGKLVSHLVPSESSLWPQSESFPIIRIDPYVQKISRASLLGESASTRSHSSGRCFESADGEDPRIVAQMDQDEESWVDLDPDFESMLGSSPTSQEANTPCNISSEDVIPSSSRGLNNILFDRSDGTNSLVAWPSSTDISAAGSPSVPVSERSCDACDANPASILPSHCNVANSSSHHDQTTYGDDTSGNQGSKSELSMESVILGPCSHTWEIPKLARRGKQPRPKRRLSTAEDERNDPRRRGAFADQRTREETALTRTLKSCIRCRVQRVRCRLDPDNVNGPCLTCQRFSRPSIYKMPCLRYIITDAALFRDQHAPNPVFSKRWQSMELVDITDWASCEIRTIKVTQNFLHAPYAIKVRKFLPANGDMLEEKWTHNGVVRTHPIRPYAIANMEETAQTLRQFVDDNIVNYMAAVLSPLDILLRNTYTMAFEHSREAPTQEERSLLFNAFRLWVACRKTSNPEQICGEDRLGIPKIDDPSSPWFNRVPIPPVMIAQMQCIVFTKLLRPLRKRILNQLQDLVQGNKKKYWFTIYLTMFLLLHSCSMVTRRNEEFARQMALPMPDWRFANPKAIKGHHIGALTMIAHFHAIKGERPFSLVLKNSFANEVAQAAELNAKQLDSVRNTAMLVKGKAAEMKAIREEKDFGNDLYWVSQLYDDAWEPGPTA